MPATTSNQTAVPDSSAVADSFADGMRERLGRLTDWGLLFAFGVAGAALYFVLTSPALFALRRTYMELGSAGRLTCASLFIAGLIFLVLSLFWTFVYAGIRLRTRRGQMRQQSRTAVTAGFQQAQQDAGVLFSHMLADMRRQGASQEEIAQARALIESVTRKVAIDSQRRLAEFQKNPAALEQEIRANVERLERGEELDGGFSRQGRLPTA